MKYLRNFFMYLSFGVLTRFKERQNYFTLFMAIYANVIKLNLFYEIIRKFLNFGAMNSMQ